MKYFVPPRDDVRSHDRFKVLLINQNHSAGDRSWYPWGRWKIQDNSAASNSRHLAGTSFVMSAAPVSPRNFGHFSCLFDHVSFRILTSNPHVPLNSIKNQQDQREKLVVECSCPLIVICDVDRELLIFCIDITVTTIVTINIQPGAVKLVLLHHWMHEIQVHPVHVTSENQFHCTRLYTCTHTHTHTHTHTSYLISSKYTGSVDTFGPFENCGLLVNTTDDLGLLRLVTFSHPFNHPVKVRERTTIGKQ